MQSIPVKWPYLGYMDNDGNLYAANPATGEVRRGGKPVRLTEQQAERLKNALAGFSNPGNLASTMYSCDGEFFRVGRLTKEAHDLEWGKPLQERQEQGR